MVGRGGAMVSFARRLSVTYKRAAGVMAAGVGIRLYIHDFLKTWPDIVKHGSTPQREAAIRTSMRRATWVLAVLHALLVVIAYLGYAKPF